MATATTRQDPALCFVLLDALGVEEALRTVASLTAAIVLHHGIGDSLGTATGPLRRGRPGPGPGPMAMVVCRARQGVLGELHEEALRSAMPVVAVSAACRSGSPAIAGVCLVARRDELEELMNDLNRAGPR